MLKHFNLPLNNFNSFVFIENGKLYQRSAGALRVTKYLSGLWPLLYAFLIVPPFIRNAVYDFVARNRYKWYGQKNECWLPTPELQKRFLE
jgi:predicted DCC family thiol-disulfide oxidoreductase YuxK